MTGEFVTVQFRNTDIISLIDRDTGYWRKGLQPQLRRAHLKMARALQRAAAEKLEAGQKGHGPNRPQRPGKRLKSAILDPRNTEIGYGAFRVGVVKWMEQDSPARLYWRAIEEGRRGYTTRALFTNSWPGDIGAPAGAGQLFSPGRGGPHMRMPQFRNAFRTKSGRSLLPPLVDVKAFPGYRYMSAMPVAFGRMDVISYYRAEGVPLAQFKVPGK